MCDARVWTPQIEALQTLANIDVVDLTGADTLTGQARVVIGAIGSQPCAIAGLSMGGIVAMEVMRLAPERVTHVALWDTNPGVFTNDQRRQRDHQIKRAELGELERMTREEFAPLYLGELSSSRPDLVETLVEMANDMGIDVFRRQSLALRDRHDNWPVLPTIAVPTLVGCGEDDQACPAARHRIMAERIPNADLVLIPNCGHLTTLERPDAVNAAMISWLQRGASP